MCHMLQFHGLIIHSNISFICMIMTNPLSLNWKQKFINIQYLEFELSEQDDY